MNAQDKNAENAEQAAIKFKAISEAYEVLADDEMRSRYDRFGKQGVTGNAASSGTSRHPGGDFEFHDPFDVFRSFFGGTDPFEDMFAGMSGHRRARQSRQHSGRSNARGASPFDAMFGGMGMGMGFGDDDMGFGSSMFGDLHSMMRQGGGSSFTMSSSSSFGGGGGGHSESVSSSTVIRNGKSVTRTTRTIRHADGRVETHTTEEEGDARSGFLQDGRGSARRSGRTLQLGHW